MFELASHLSMSLDDVCEKHSERQVRLWIIWLQQQWNKPNRTDYYILKMIQTWCRDGVTLDQLRINWEFRDKSAEPVLSEEERRRLLTVIAKARFEQAAGVRRGE